MVGSGLNDRLDPQPRWGATMAESLLGGAAPRGAAGWKGRTRRRRIMFGEVLTETRPDHANWGNCEYILEATISAFRWGFQVYRPAFLGQ